MRNTKKAFTLVELIVVITILAILATVAFVSLGGQTDNARNTVKKDSLGKLATAVENARTNGLALSAFLANTGSNLSSGDIAGTGVVALAAAKHYGAGDINLTALDVKAADFQDGTNNFKYGYTSKIGGKYELAATVKEGDLQKAYVVGTYSPRTQSLTTIDGTGTHTSGSSNSVFKLAKSTDIKKLGYGDYVGNGSATGKIIAVSPDYMTLTVEGNIGGASTIKLAADDSKGLIKSDTSGAPVQIDTENIPYKL